MRLVGVFLILAAIVALASCKGKKGKKEKKKLPDWSYKKGTENTYSYSLHKKIKVLGLKDWGESYDTCKKGKAQSPINIVPKKAKKTKFGPLKLKFDPNTEDKKQEKFFKGKFVNNGKYPIFKLNQEKGNRITIKFDKKKYILDNFISHFGCLDNKGSEHTIKDKAFDSEIQFVFYNKKYKTLKKAEKKKNGLLVLSALVEKSPDPFYYWGKYTGLDGLMTTLVTVISSGYVRVGSPIVYDELPLRELIPELFKAKDTKDVGYYTYKGSLSHPDCHENVRWVVLKDPIKVSGYLLNTYRNLKRLSNYYYFDLLCDNYRPVQKLGKRKVEVYKPKKKKKLEDVDQASGSGDVSSDVTGDEDGDIASDEEGDVASDAESGSGEK